MNWDIQDTIGRRHEFVTLALAGKVSMAELCRRFGISRKTGYKWRQLRRDHRNRQAPKKPLR